MSIRVALAGLAGVAIAIPGAAVAAPNGSSTNKPTSGPAVIEPLPLQPPNLTATGGPTRQQVQQAFDEMITDGAIGIVGRVNSPATNRAWSSGARRVWSSLPANVHAKFRVASNTKMMVATLVMQEIERGTWSLNTTVDQIWPGLLGTHGYVTLEQLLSHRSGLPDGLAAVITAHMHGQNTYAAYFRAIGDDYSDQEIIAGALSTPWLFPPGTSFSYSNAGYVVLGQLLEKQTGQKVGTLLQQRIFKPAHMVNTSFPTAPGVPAGSLVDAANAPVPPRWYSLTNFNPEVFSSAGAVISTTADLDRFTSALLGGRLVKPATVAQMIRPRTMSPLQYGLGIYRVGDPCTPPGQPLQYLYGHDGASFGTFSVALASRDGSRQISLGAIGRYYQSLQQPYDLNTPLLALALASCTS